jgi:membrane protease YdiL (CAAX protease family)
MSAPTSTQQPAPHSALGSLVARHPVASFLVMVYTVNTVVALPPVRTHTDILPLPFGLAPYEALGTIFGVALPAFIVVAAMHGKAGVLDLARRSLRWRVGIRWYLIALLGVPIGVVLCASAIYGLAPLNALVEKWPGVFTVVLPKLLLLFVFFLLAEEIGWMGFLQARLQERHGPLKASVIVTLPFALFHLPVVMVDDGLGLAQLHLALGFVGVLGILQLFGRVVIMWLYNNTNYSVLLVGVFHSSFNSTASTPGFAGEFIPGSAGVLIASGVVTVAAVLIVVYTRGCLSYEPDRTPQSAAASP